jgi:predicted  nucleic acid-binding Zn-ribbon protein
LVKFPMHKLSRLRRSRDSWKGKATNRAEQVRELKKTKARQQKRIKLLKEHIASLEQALLSEKKAKLPRPVNSSALMKPRRPAWYVFC